MDANDEGGNASHGPSGPEERDASASGAEEGTGAADRARAGDRGGETSAVGAADPVPGALSSVKSPEHALSQESHPEESPPGRAGPEGRSSGSEGASAGWPDPAAPTSMPGPRQPEAPHGPDSPATGTAGPGTAATSASGAEAATPVVTTMGTAATMETGNMGTAATAGPLGTGTAGTRAEESGTGEAGTPAPVTGVAALRLPYQIVVALALAVVAVGTLVHVGLVFLHVAPPNTLTKQHGQAVEGWVYPEFEQNWKLFAPNPLQQNISVQARAEYQGEDGAPRTTGWYDLSAIDGAAIDGSLLPSHTEQNTLRRAWDFYTATHDVQERPSGQRGDLSERHLRRIVVMRLYREGAARPGDVLERVQVRSRTTNVPPPEWSQEKVSGKPVIRELPWWTVAERDRTGAGA